MKYWKYGAVICVVIVGSIISFAKSLHDAGGMPATRPIETPTTHRSELPPNTDGSVQRRQRAVVKLLEVSREMQELASEGEKIQYPKSKFEISGAPATRESGTTRTATSTQGSPD